MLSAQRTGFLLIVFLLLMAFVAPALFAAEPSPTGDTKAENATQQPAGRVLKVMNYNIQIAATAKNPSWSRSKFDLDGIVAMIKQHDPDIVALQEVDRFRHRSNYADQVAYIAEKLGMYWAYSPSYFDVEVSQGRGMYGNAILSKYPIVSSFAHTLWRRGDLNPGEAAWVIEKRSLLETKIDVNGRFIYVYSTHLSTTPDQRGKQIRDIVETVGQVRGPKLVMGDFNSLETDPEMQPIYKNLRNAFNVAETAGTWRNTWPNGSKATEAIDFIFVTKEFQVKEINVIVDETGASDHNPIVGTVVLP